jgi:conserved oligomeric Golgi complex subunit 4
MLDEEGYATADYQDIARKRFIKAWEGLVDGYKVIRLVNIYGWLPH